MPTFIDYIVKIPFDYTNQIVAQTPTPAPPHQPTGLTVQNSVFVCVQGWAIILARW